MILLSIECNIYTCTGTVHKYNTCTYNVQCTMYMYNKYITCTCTTGG